MTKINQDPEHLQRKLWDEIKESRFGMLGLADDARQLQPMTAFAEPHERSIWFFAKADNDLVKALADTSDGVFVIQSKDQDLQACVIGDLELQHDRGRIDKFWNPVVAAWFPKGRDDPSLAVLRLSARRAEIWIAQTGPIKMAWEIAKARTLRKEPDLGDHGSVNLGGSSALR
jgi:general stress protein 26